jgi:hypothetical protein
MVDAEHPFLAYIKDTHEWTVITLQRVIWKECGHVHSVRIDELNDATVPDSVLASLTPQVKRQLSQLKLVSKDGTELAAPFEAGKPFAGFWNVLKTMIAQQKDQQARA